MKVHTILFPVDFSDVASNALDFAAQWAVLLDADLLLLHVNENPYGAPAQESNPLPLDTVNTRLINSKLESLLQDLLVRSGARCRSLIEEGTFENVIPEVVRSRNIDLIVMGTAGASGASALFSGSLTLRIMDRTQVPILVIPQEATYQPTDFWLYASDLKGNENVMINRVLSLATSLNARLEVLHVKTKANEEVIDPEILRLKRPLANLDFNVIEGTNVLDSVQAYMAQKHPGLLVLARHQHDFFDRLFKRDRAAYAVQHITMPMLVFFEPKASDGDYSGQGGLPSARGI